MESALIILNQLLKMAIYCTIGFVLHRRNMISKEGCKALSTLLLYVILPCVLIASFIREKNPETTQVLIVSIIAGAILLAISLAVSKLLYRKNSIDEFSASFSNAGFMGMPLIASAYGNEKVFYIAAFTAYLNIFQWTYGQRLLSKDEKISVKSVLLNPLVISLEIGLILYFTQIQIPEQIIGCISSISACNGPIAMIILGFYIADIPIKEIFMFKQGYWVTTGRLVIIPLISMLALKLIPNITNEVKQIMLIAACAPVGINVAIYAQRLNQDYKRASILICQSTILCVLTMPLIIGLSSIFFA